MEERRIAPSCERGNDLIAFIYGEEPDAAAEFRTHLKNCQQCSRELASFQEIRESILTWKQEALGVVPATTENESRPFVRFESRKPSALAAIKAFFDLSPLWMKAAVGFSCIVFCIAVALASLRLFDNRQPLVTGNQKRYTEADLKTEIEKALAKEREQIVVKTEVSPNQSGTPERRSLERRVSKPGSIVESNQNAKQRPLTRSERQQLAADLRLISEDDDSDFGLLGDRINR